MRGESTAEIVVVEGTGDGCSSAVKVNKSPDEKEKLKAAELLGKRFGLFIDKQRNIQTLDIKENWFDVESGDSDK